MDIGIDQSKEVCLRVGFGFVYTIWRVVGTKLTSKLITGKSNTRSENNIERSGDYSARVEGAVRTSAEYRSGVRGDA